MAALFLAAALSSGTASAGVFQVSPVRVELSPEQKSAALTVRNDGEEPVVVQVQAMSWSQVDARDVYQPTDDILATPPIFTVKPGASQVLRVGLRRAADIGQELSYRVYLQEVPAAPKPGFQGLQVAMRLGLPVFVQAQTRAAPVLHWKIQQLARGRFRVTLNNDGLAHVQVTDFTLSLPGKDQPVAVQQVSTYLLPGQEREWTLAVDPVQTANSAKMRLKGYTDAGNVDTEVTVERQ